MSPPASSRLNQFRRCSCSQAHAQSSRANPTSLLALQIHHCQCTLCEHILHSSVHLDSRSAVPATVNSLRHLRFDHVRAVGTSTPLCASGRIDGPATAQYWVTVCVKNDGRSESALTCHTSARKAGLRERHSAAVVPGAPGPRTAATYAATSAAASLSRSPAPRCTQRQPWKPLHLAQWLAVECSISQSDRRHRTSELACQDRICAVMLGLTVAVNYQGIRRRACGLRDTEPHDKLEPQSISGRISSPPQLPCRRLQACAAPGRRSNQEEETLNFYA